MAHADHLKASQHISVRCAVVTLSDTRTLETDTSGNTIARLLTDAQHTLLDHRILKDEPIEFEGWLKQLLQMPDCDAILTTGGTGISRRDQTISVVERSIEQPLPGFGELFRYLSYGQIGSGAMLSRAVAGIAAGKVIFAMPGSTPAVELAMTRLILPEIRHLVHELRK